jgi:transcriptional regulator with XRE-family HTH domain
MKIYEKIKSMRKLKDWSQEEMAHRLEMSVSGYGGIERGEIDIPLSRLEKIAEVFEISLKELFSLNDKNDKNICHVGIGNDNTLTHSLQINSLPPDSMILQHELEKSRLLLEQQTIEIELLKQQNADLRAMINLLQKE